jgi:hypothetical protein
MPACKAALPGIANFCYFFMEVACAGFLSDNSSNFDELPGKSDQTGRENAPVM